VSFAAITLHVASERMFIDVSIYFIIDSVRKLLDTPSYYLEAELLTHAFSLLVRFALFLYLFTDVGKAVT
jgi:hypothetical protein